MGFLSSRLWGGSKDEPDEEEEQEEEGKSSSFPKLVHGMPLDVSVQKGKPLLSGRLIAFSKSELTIERKPGQLSFNTCEVGTTAFIRGLNDGAMPFDLKGIVEESSRLRFRVKDLEPVTYEENRANFRIVVNTPATLYYEDDKHFSNPEKCVLVDISATGACIQSEYIHGEDEVLRLKVQLEEYVPLTFLGQVVRVEEPVAGKFRYGFLFAQMDEQETKALTKQLFNIQVGNKKERSRGSAGPGHW